MNQQLNAHHLITQSFHFTKLQEEITDNALAFSLQRRNNRALDYLAKKNQRPSIMDKAKDYFNAVV